MPLSTRGIDAQDCNDTAPEDRAEAGDHAWDTLLELVTSRPKRAPDRKQNRSKRTEQQILNAALRVFARDGISRSRIADIAAEAGISTSTLYEYYKSKEDLAYDLPNSHLVSFFQEYRAAVVGKTSAREKLLLYLSMSADFAREHADWGRLFYLEIWPSVLVSETELRHSVDDFARIARYLIDEGVRQGEFPAGRNSYETASLLLGAVNQVIITWLLYRRPRNLTKASAEMADRVITMIANERP
ncbi:MULTISPECIES: TetR/AcrR family transcriptional regulator [unclassified Novosphingobium]|uniref:TetR/AcrR family transcriptional regulator n=1 Tax=unclassified Novosphingobium TaxID=2644732 RepID=UPI000D31391A|nr:MULTISPECIES: TetR/AcrR family transcriptional regulator [unclassified Novosphingobium]MBB3359994.1 AcrR family transcriptional regulator [Novosphingobium sp. BK256]MBB3376353.1 AcrR family transcriptional regulator [Novosphingobium sp. BK280]MBB3380766.1 AcrR family transcriptional regulator [Novosphingobium sp. BK258]MBB3422418.1 AcrR family transcriptional regulator [Novosphingobium sp. BK267]MBB3451117.1 AcrR family transcriptional regulator [Novosphingobium sp. BK352]